MRTVTASTVSYGIIRYCMLHIRHMSLRYHTYLYLYTVDKYAMMYTFQNCTDCIVLSIEKTQTIRWPLW